MELHLLSFLNEGLLASYFIAYGLLTAITGKVFYTASYLFLEALIFFPVFGSLSFFQRYFICSVVYSYVFTKSESRDSKAVCALLSVMYFCEGVDTFLYGAGGYLGEDQTVFWKAVPSIGLGLHILLIYTLLPVGGILNGIRDIFIASRNIAANSDFMLVIRYNTYKALN